MPFVFIHLPFAVNGNAADLVFPFGSGDPAQCGRNILHIRVMIADTGVFVSGDPEKQFAAGRTHRTGQFMGPIGYQLDVKRWSGWKGLSGNRLYPQKS